MLSFDSHNEKDKLNALIADALDRVYHGKERKRCTLSGLPGAGKTELAASYAQNHLSAARYFSCRHLTAPDAKETFLHLFLPQEEAPDQWDEVFDRLLAEKFARVPVLFVDDFDFCADEAFSCGLKKLQNARFVVIYIEEENAEKSFRKESVEILPRAIWHFAKALPDAEAADAARLWAITGGLPAACKEVDAALSLEENLRRMLHFDSSLVTFFPSLLHRSIRAPESYYPILSALAQGKHRISEIAKAAGYPNNKTDTYLKALIERHIVEVRKAENERSAAYHLTNSYFKFWMLYIYPNRERLIANPEDVMQTVLQTIDKTLMLPCVHGACKRYLQQFSYQNRMEESADIRWAATRFPQAFQPVSFTFKDGCKVKIDFICKYRGVTYFAVFPRNAEQRFTKEDVERYYRVMRRYAPPFDTRLLLFGFHRFSDWCVKESAETKSLYCIPVERLKY